MAKPKTGRDALPQRFRPLYDQALTESDLRYGAQESALGSVLGQLGRDRDRQLLAQKTAQQSLLGSMQQSDNNVNRFYTDSGLTPSVLSSLAGSNTGARLAGEMAGYRSQNAQNLISAQAGGQYQQQRINQDYGDKTQTVLDQLKAEQKERGTFTSSALEQLISGDRSARHTANEAARKQAHADAQAVLDRNAANTNALISQGLVPDANGNLQPLPGGKADPNAPANQPKPKPRTTGPGTADKGAQLATGKAFKSALALAQGMKPDAAHADKVEALLTNGSPASGGKPIYQEVPVLDARGKPKVDANGAPVTKQVKVLWRAGDKDAAGKPINPALIGTVRTSSARPALPKFDAEVAAAATEQAIYGYVTTATVRDLQKLGFSVNQIPGLITENQARQNSGPNPNPSTPIQAVPGLGGAAPATPSPDRADRPSQSTSSQSTVKDILANPSGYTAAQVRAARALRKRGAANLNVMVDRNGGAG